MPQQLARNVLSWASQLDERAGAQASAAAAMPFVAGHLALMPDAHVGKGATIGSVIPTRGAIMPAAVGVDIGCGMSAAETVLTAADLPDDLGPLLSRLEARVPPTAGQGPDHEGAGERWLGAHGLPRTELTGALERKTVAQFATLGSGNHFWELCLDERDRVWIMLHSGSRGIGNVLAQQHIQRAKGLMATWFVSLPDPDLAYLVEGTPEFDHYIADLLWAQAYAAGSRARMTEVGLAALADAVGRPGGDHRHPGDRLPPQLHHP
jgi:tRNA-splicing ligase RtcB